MGRQNSPVSTSKPLANPPHYTLTTLSPLTSLHTHLDHCAPPTPQDFNLCASTTFVIVPWPLLTTSWAELITSLNYFTAEILDARTHPTSYPSRCQYKFYPIWLLPPAGSHLLPTTGSCSFATLFNPSLWAQSAQSFASYLLSFPNSSPIPSLPSSSSVFTLQYLPGWRHLLPQL